MFTPKELQEQTFDKAVFGGYDMKQVDEFLEPLTVDYTNLYKENSVLKSKMKILVEKLEEYRSQDSSLKKTLVAAQQTAEGIIADAQKKASQIINDAENTASAKIAESQHLVDLKTAECQDQIDAEEARVRQAQGAAQSFINAVETEVQNHVDMLEQLRKLASYTTSSASAPKRAAGVKKAEPVVEAPVEETPVEEAPVETAPVDDFFSLDEGLASEISAAVDAISGASHSGDDDEQLTFDGAFKFADL